MRFVIMTLVFFLATVAPCAAAPLEANAGYRSLVTWLPGSQIRVDVAVWYPTQRNPGAVRAGTWSFIAARNAQPLPGPWPLVILSHDSTGSRFSHHDLAASLAKQGFIVAAPTHDGDNIEDMRLLFTAKQLPTRARQLSATLDLVLENPELGPEVDTTRVMLAGFGNGGSAGFLLAGAGLTSGLWNGFCESNPGSPYCAPLIAYNMQHMADSIRNETALEQEAAQHRELAMLAREHLLVQNREAVTRAHSRVLRAQKRPAVNVPSPPVFLPLLPPLPSMPDIADPRFKAMIFISPGFSMFFEQNSLARVSIPLLFILSDADPLNNPAEQGEALGALTGGPAPFYLRLDNTGIPALQALCPPDMEQELPDLCQTVTPQQRMQLREQLDAAIVAFTQSLPLREKPIQDDHEQPRS